VYVADIICMKINSIRSSEYGIATREIQSGFNSIKTPDTIGVLGLLINYRSIDISRTHAYNYSRTSTTRDY
jgi:hypothetical protein